MAGVRQPHSENRALHSRADYEDFHCRFTRLWSIWTKVRRFALLSAQPEGESHPRDSAK